MPPLSLGAIGAPVMRGSPSSARVPPRFLADLCEEEAIIGEQGREEEEKEKEKKKRSWGLLALNMFSDFGQVSNR